MKTEPITSINFIEATAVASMLVVVLAYTKPTSSSPLKQSTATLVSFEPTKKWVRAKMMLVNTSHETAQILGATPNCGIQFAGSLPIQIEPSKEALVEVAIKAPAKNSKIELSLPLFIAVGEKSKRVQLQCLFYSGN